MAGSEIPAKRRYMEETALFRNILRVSRLDTIGGQGYRRVTHIPKPSSETKEWPTGRTTSTKKTEWEVRGNRRGDGSTTIPPRDPNSRYRPRRKREYYGRYPVSDRNRRQTQPRKRPNTRWSRTNTLMAGTIVTAGGCVGIGTTPEVHVTVISNEGGTGEIVMETSLGIHLPGGTRPMDRRIPPGPRTGGTSTSRTSNKASRLQTTCRLSCDTGSGGKSTSERA